MSAITVNGVRDSVMTILHQHFPGISVYSEEIRQGFDKPCFFVKLFPVSQNQLLGRRYQRNHSFDIGYFPVVVDEGEGEGNRQNQDMHDVAEQLYEAMELIPVVDESDGLMRGTKMGHEIVEGVLHFYVDYNFQVIKEATLEPLMQTMEQEGFIRG
ncbi:phage tail terminator family protein [Desulfitobacterium hafniense]|uniref:Phage protein n=5 Tax=root TaxID=1 RepID=Q24QE5_DESHY|nr:hypothetical protein [Desulfitobacterium hafniense]ACL19467.1 phage protein [Desulfitobacterium hafniense DCB-2]EHL04018.1 hypothetical protein HMPREF0322_05305 [Desulfitobacterium hafniense DP7]KTE89283.1 hypothetical protein AT727_12845 [Desulfitobacterium hafniense]MEA5023579.1 hypothetical protein [Desulfitobacterium hafniense]BAE85747.1 hypothetical protein DSY3958 [Desulfitobacterium hafniense Y51]